jgi:hypothetical protein
MSHPHSTPENPQHGGATLEERLATFYTAVSRATAFGHFKGHHGPLEETAWLHIAIHQLDELDRLAAGVLDQDVRCLARLRSVIDQPPYAEVIPAAFDVERGTQVLQGREPAVVATVALLLDRLTPSQHSYTDKALRYYAARAKSIQQVLDLAAAVVSGDSPSDSFRDYVAQLNPLASATRAEHGAHLVTAQSVDHSHDAEHTHDHLSNGVHEAFAAVMESAAHAHGGSVETIAAACHCNALSAASKAKIEQLSVFLRENEPIWRQFLTDGDSPLIHGRLIELPKRANRPRCVTGQPQSGGQWEIASLRATETDELCPPGQALHDAGSKVYGRAGANLIKAQNEWIKAKQCFGDADKKTGDCREAYKGAVRNCKSIQCTSCIFWSNVNTHSVRT